MKQIAAKLRSRAGESLVETLAAILIFTLTSVALLSMVDAASGINRTAKEQDAFVQEQMVTAEKAEIGSGRPGTASITFSGSDGTPIRTESVDVEIYGDSTDGLYSYFKK